MILFKKADTFGQIALIIGFIIFGLVSRNESFIYGYFVVGAWQVVSAIINYGLCRNMPFVKERDVYYKILLWTLGIGVISFIVTPVLIYYLFAILFLTPFVAIYYCWLSYRELNMWEGKKLIHLK